MQEVCNSFKLVRYDVKTETKNMFKSLNRLAATKAVRNPMLSTNNTVSVDALICKFNEFVIITYLYKYKEF
jgi:hypothetical protein